MMKHAKNRNTLAKMFQRCSKILLVFLSLLLLTCAYQESQRARDNKVLHGRDDWWQCCPICSLKTETIIIGEPGIYQDIQDGKEIFVTGRKFYCKCANNHDWYYLNGMIGYGKRKN